MDNDFEILYSKNLNNKFSTYILQNEHLLLNYLLWKISKSISIKMFQQLSVFIIQKLWKNRINNYILQ